MNRHPSARRALARRLHSRSCSLASLCAGLITVFLWLPGAASADSISLSVKPAPVQELTSQITFQAVIEAEGFAAVDVNAPGIPCAPDPEADDGTTIIAPEDRTLPSPAGPFEGSGNYTPASTGAYTICGWLIRSDLDTVNGRGPITASSSVPLDVRAPNVSLALSLPRPARVGKPFAVDVHIASEVPRELVVEDTPLGSHRCPVNPAAGSEERFIDTEIDGGPWVKRFDVEALPAGRYLFCAWADPPADHGLDPQVSRSLIVTVRRSKHRRVHHPHASRPSGARCPEFSTCQHGGGPFGP